jgi:signal transduction histidine kinase
MPAFPVDRRRLTEVYQNLLDNAIKFMGEQKQPKIEVGCKSRDGRQVLYVKDNGCGIDARYLDKIFGLFDQLDQRIPGTGIGLALVTRVIETHGGTVWAESPGEDAGATLNFTLNGTEENTNVGQ